VSQFKSRIALSLTCGLVTLDGDRYKWIHDSKELIPATIIENCRIWSKATASFRNIEIRSLAAIWSSIDPPLNSALPSRYLINCASPHEAMTSHSSLNGGKNFSFSRYCGREGWTKMVQDQEKLWRERGLI
jgi:hypothetical protein